ncbi:hypothetical protein MNBD_DELTA01-2129 [hydrothermal vent metagenome]|uniref:Uncharacterized protein n=1 Tax=hydrothermal vent metagenome TaxID=652676 RepID=A0A3B0R702_9ZZZZ
MKRQLTIALVFTIVVFFAMTSVALARRSRKLQREPTVVERIIRVEGSVEKPRVLFIVPRSKLWRGGFLNKSFKDDIMMPVYPDKLIKQWARPSYKGG